MQAKPLPKRFYWLKRLFLAIVLLLFLVVGLRLVWGHRVQARLDDAVADIHARGEPILFEDLQFEPLPDPENGAWYLRQALNQWPTVPGSPGLRITDSDWYNEGEEAGYTDPITDNAAYLKSCETVFDLLRQAEECEDADWNGQISRPLFYHQLPHLGDSRELARLVTDAGERSLGLDDLDRAFEAMLHLHGITRHVQSRSISSIESLVGISIMAMNRDLIERALPQMDAEQLREGPAREKAKQLIARLTDGMLYEGMVAALIGERVSKYDIYECMLDGTETAANLIGDDHLAQWLIDTPGLNFLIRPAIKNEQLANTQALTQIIAAMRDSASISESAEIVHAFENKFYGNPLLYPLEGLYFGIYDSTHRTYLRSEVLLRCAAIAIAIKLYEADHGQRPETLNQLVPAYLPAIPIDPFSNTGEPIRYKPGGVTPTLVDEFNQLTDEQRRQLAIRPYPLLYSIGEDGIDHSGGPIFMYPEGDLDEFNRFPSASDGESGDIWFLLDAWPEAVFEEGDLVGGNQPPEPLPYE
eukprot:g12391.t1